LDFSGVEEFYFIESALCVVSGFVHYSVTYAANYLPVNYIEAGRKTSDSALREQKIANHLEWFPSLLLLFNGNDKRWSRKFVMVPGLLGLMITDLMSPLITR
jgi:hypothetical protein